MEYVGAGYALKPVDPPEPTPELPAPAIKEARASPVPLVNCDGLGPAVIALEKLNTVGVSLPPSSVCQTPMYPTETECVSKFLLTSMVRLPLFCGKLASPEFCVAPRGA